MHDCIKYPGIRTTSQRAWKNWLGRL